MNLSLGNIALETVFGLTAIFLYFAPKLLGWSGWSHLGGVFFTALALIVVAMKRSG